MEKYKYIWVFQIMLSGHIISMLLATDLQNTLYCFVKVDE